MCSQSERLRKNQLIEQYMPLVRKLAKRFTLKLPASVEFDDMLQVATMGLIDAWNRFSEEGGASFESYATQRIMGAMLDELRQGDWLPRNVRKQENVVDRSVQRLEHRLGRRATESEVARELGEPIKKYQLFVGDIHRGQMLYFEDLARGAQVDDDQPASEYSEAFQTDDLDPLTLLEQSELRHLVVEILNDLPEQQRKILYLRYETGHSFDIIADEIGVSESRVCQIRNLAIASVRTKLAERLATSNS
jgi:RNA polymerase sigma factor for flagellar operon FliA